MTAESERSGRGGRRRRGMAMLAVTALAASALAIAASHPIALAQEEEEETTPECSGTAAVSMSTTNTGLIADCNALLAVKDALDPDGRLNWATDVAIDSWDGISIFWTPPRVYSIDLRLDSLWVDAPSSPIVPVALGGTVPAGLANVTALNRLTLAGNDLTGTIPTELGSISSLTALLLDRNQLTGSIPTQLGNLTNLDILGLSDNQLSGSIPSQLGNLTKLRALDLRINRLSGSIPSQLTQLTNLEVLFLANNSLSGSIPAGFGSLSKSEGLELFDNELTGSVPTQFGNLTKLKHLRLSNNMLSGEIPSSLTSLTLESLWLANNNFTCIPAGLSATQTDGYSIPECSEMSTPLQQSPGGPADGAECADTAAVAVPGAGAALISDCNALLAARAALDPGGLLNWATSVSMLDWDGITLTAPPRPAVRAVDLASRSLRGSIPAELGDLSKLRTLKLGGNRLRGSIPAELGDLSKLRTLKLGGNRLTGCVPAALRDVGNNDLARLGLADCEPEAGE